MNVDHVIHADALRGVLEVFEAGVLNSAQRQAIHNVRVILGDAEGTGCPHARTAYGADNVLRCEDCHEVITYAEAGDRPNQT